MSRRLLGLALLLALLGAATSQAAPLPLAGVSVVLDPGHGGDDWGVDPAGSGLSEKQIVLDIAERIAAQLRAAGATVYLTRTSDEFVSLQARVRFSNAVLFRPDNRADLGRSISVHLNSNSERPTLTRIEVRVDPAAPADPFAALLAVELERVTGGGFGFRDAGYPPGVHPEDVAPVRWTYPRSANVLTEAAFLSNPTHAALLHQPAWLDKLAAAHVRALRQTLGR